MMHPPEVVLRTQLAAKLGAAVAIALPFSNIGFQIALQSVNRVSNNFCRAQSHLRKRFMASEKEIGWAIFCEPITFGIQPALHLLHDR